MIASIGLHAPHAVAAAMTQPLSQTASRGTQVEATNEQRKVYSQSVRSMVRAQKRVHALSSRIQHARHNVSNVRRGLDQATSAADEMLKAHDRFVRSLTEEQWNLAQANITELERLRAALHMHLSGIGLELQMPSPQTDILENYAKRLDKDFTEWRELYRAVGATTGVARPKIE